MEKLRGFISRFPFFIKLFHWEYWPFNLVYIPVFVYYLNLSLRARSFFFFSASNPSVETGGMIGESKWEITKLLPPQFSPKTVLVEEKYSFAEAKEKMPEQGIGFPVIVKPDRGERGWLVEKIVNEEELRKYMQEVRLDFLIQEYIELPLEMSIFYYRYPNNERGEISSVVIKQLLQVEGNGQSDLLELIKSHPRARLQLKVLKENWSEKLNYVPAKGEIVELVPIGNHSRGAMFLDANYLIDEELINAFDILSKQIQGFYFGRYDLRCNSLEELKRLQNFKILELNCAGAEPSHIYQPGFSLFKAYSVIFKHLRVLYEISMMNNEKGIPFMNWNDFMSMRRFIKEYRAKAGVK